MTMSHLDKTSVCIGVGRAGLTHPKKWYICVCHRAMCITHHHTFLCCSSGSNLMRSTPLPASNDSANLFCPLQLLHLLQVGEFLLQFSDHLSKSKQDGQAETVDLHTLSVKEARAAVLCVLCNIQVCPSPACEQNCFLSTMTWLASPLHVLKCWKPPKKCSVVCLDVCAALGTHIKYAQSFITLVMM